MKTLTTFLKGKLTVTSITAYLASGQLLDAINVANQIEPVFEKGLGTGTVLDIVFGLGALWGILRKFTSTYKNAR